MAIWCFISLPGNPLQIYSDNATIFIKASEQLKIGIEILRTDNAYRDTLLLLHLTYRFIPASSPLFSGSWESLVKKFKNAFCSVIGSRTLPHDTLPAFVSEITGMMNWSTSNSSIPITHNHFLLARPSPNFHRPSSKISQLQSPAIGGKSNSSPISF